MSACARSRTSRHSRKLETTAPTVAAAIVGAGVPLTRRIWSSPIARPIKDGRHQGLQDHREGEDQDRVGFVSDQAHRLNSSNEAEKVIRDGKNGSRRVAYGSSRDGSG
jgi:hypothetical protein